MTDPALDTELSDWFERYRQAFLSGPKATAACYNVPCLTARGGIVRCHVDADRIEAFWTEVMATYAKRGYVNGRVVSLAGRPMGTNACSADVTWSYVDSADRELWRWSLTYVLYRSGADWRIMTQVLHDAG